MWQYHQAAAACERRTLNQLAPMCAYATCVVVGWQYTARNIHMKCITFSQRYFSPMLLLALEVAASNWLPQLRLLRAWKKDEKIKQACDLGKMLWNVWQHLYRMRVIRIHSSQSDNNSRSKHEKWDKRQHPKKDQISQLQFYPFQNSKLKPNVEQILAPLQPFS